MFQPSKSYYLQHSLTLPGLGVDTLPVLCLGIDSRFPECAEVRRQNLFDGRMLACEAQEALIDGLDGDTMGCGDIIAADGLIDKDLGQHVPGHCWEC